MGRKKKKEEEPEIYHTPFGSTTIRPPEYDLSPYLIEPEWFETTSLSDTQRRYITTPGSGTSLTYTGSTGEVRTVYYPPRHLEPYSTTIGYEGLMRQIEKEEEAKVKVNVEHFKGKYVCCVIDDYDLSPERILITLSAVKGRLMFEMAPVHIKEIQCSMTPTVKKHIIEASKKLKMYGKKCPIIPSFDEYGNRLPDQLEIGDNKGILVKIVNPEEYGEMYFELKAIEFDSVTYNPSGWETLTTTPWIDDVPF